MSHNSFFFLLTPLSLIHFWETIALTHPLSLIHFWDHTIYLPLSLSCTYGTIPLTPLSLMHFWDHTTYLPLCPSSLLGPFHLLTPLSLIYFWNHTTYLPLCPSYTSGTIPLTYPSVLHVLMGPYHLRPVHTGHRMRIRCAFNAHWLRPH